MIDDGVVVEGERGRGRRGVGQAVIDLVRDEPQAEIAGRSRRAAPGPSRADHGPGGVGRAHGEHAVRAALRGARASTASAVMIQPSAFVSGMTTGVKVERRQDVAVGRIARRRDRDPVAGIEQAQEGEHEAGRRAGRHDHPLRGEARPRKPRGSGGRCARAAGRCRAPRCSRCARRRAPPWRPRGRRAAPAPRAGRPPCG